MLFTYTYWISFLFLDLNKTDRIGYLRQSSGGSHCLCDRWHFFYSNGQWCGRMVVESYFKHFDYSASIKYDLRINNFPQPRDETIGDLKLKGWIANARASHVCFPLTFSAIASAFCVRFISSRDKGGRVRQIAARSGRRLKKFM